MREIVLTKGYVATVDATDFDWLNQWKWHVGSAGQYAMRAAGPRRAVVNIQMHRLITDAPKGLVVDHIDGDTLNNTRANLRVCTAAENARNRFATRPGKFKGVHEDPRFPGLFEARCLHNWLGRYDTAEKAARVYDAAAAIAYGEFARLNLPEMVGQPLPDLYPPKIPKPNAMSVDQLVAKVRAKGL